MPDIPEIEVPNLETDKPPQYKPAPTKEGWYPSLNPTQELIFNDTARFQLIHGEKGSGKTIIANHCDVRHSYENNDALTLLISPSMRAGNEGAWHDLLTLVLPQWKEGFGLEHSDSKLDPNTKDRHIWIANRFGGWSKILLMSIPHASMVAPRMKQMAPSRVHVEELTDCEGRAYFTDVSQQIGRRRNITGPQQYVGTCNAKGISNWVYQVFFIESIDPQTRERNPKYSVFHVPIQENIHRLPEGYVENLYETYKSDPIQLRRLIHGEWVDRPTGDAIFKDYWTPEHFKGDAARGLYLHPLKGFPVDVGLDPGPVNFAVSFQQTLPTAEGKLLTIVFDEINKVGTPTPYRVVVAEILRKMDFWSEVEDYDFTYEFSCDEASFNTANRDGKMDYIAIQDLARDPETGEFRIILHACPKGGDSVPAAVRMMQAMLQEGELVISAKCPKTKESFENLESIKVKDGEYDAHAGYRPRRSPYLHQWDATRYALLRRRLRGVASESQIIKPQVYAAGAALS